MSEKNSILVTLNGVTLVGFQHKEYTSKKTGNLIKGCNLFLTVPSNWADVTGLEVLTEFVSPKVVEGITLNVGMQLDLIYSRGYGGKAMVTKIIDKGYDSLPFAQSSGGGRK